MKKQFFTTMRSIDWQDAIAIRPVSYLKESVDPDSGWWDTCLQYFPDIPHDSDILDVGTWFGIFPKVLKEMGYTNVDCTECSAHNEGMRDDLEKLHQLFDIAPYEFEVFPGREFHLPKQYDLITILHTNMHWKINELFCIKNSIGGKVELSKNWQVKDSENATHTFFVPWKLEEWKIFVECIRRQLKPGGMCIMMPHPWPYDYLGYEDVADYLEPFVIESSITQSILCIT